MSLKHALLGFLNHRPLTGYELKRYFDDSVQHFWNANLSQIYPTLGTMREEGLLEMAVKVQENAPSAKVYHITEAGRHELDRWLKEPCDLVQHREAFLIRVFFGSAMTRQDLLRQLEDQLRRHRKRLALYQDMIEEGRKANPPCDPRPEQDKAFGYYTLRAGVLHEEAMIAWCLETMAAVTEAAEE